MSTGAQPSLDPNLTHLIAQGARTEANTVFIKGEVKEMKHKLFGNGTVGILKEHDLRIAAIEQTAKEKSIRLGTAKWMIRIIGACLVWIWGVAMGAGSWLPKIKAWLHMMGW